MPRRQTTAITVQDRLTEPQQRAASLLAMGRCVDDVTQQVDVTVDELYQWRQMPLFVAAVNAQLHDARESAQQRLRALTAPALDLIERALADEGAPPQIRLQLALKILDLVGAGEHAKREIGSADPKQVEANQRQDAYLNSLEFFA